MSTCEGQCKFVDEDGVTVCKVCGFAKNLGILVADSQNNGESQGHLVTQYGNSTVLFSSKRPRQFLDGASKPAVYQALRQMRELSASFDSAGDTASHAEGLFYACNENATFDRIPLRLRAVACLYHVIRLRNEPITIKAFAGRARVPMRIFLRVFRLVSSTLKQGDVSIPDLAIVPRNEQTSDTQSESNKQSDAHLRHALNLLLNKRVLTVSPARLTVFDKYSTLLLNLAEHECVSTGKAPSIFVGAVLCLATVAESKIPLPRGFVGRVARCLELKDSTLRSHMNEMSQMLLLLAQELPSSSSIENMHTWLHFLLDNFESIATMSGGDKFPITTAVPLTFAKHEKAREQWKATIMRAASDNDCLDDDSDDVDIIRFLIGQGRTVEDLCSRSREDLHREVASTKSTKAYYDYLLDELASFVDDSESLGSCGDFPDDVGDDEEQPHDEETVTRTTEKLTKS